MANSLARQDDPRELIKRWFDQQGLSISDWAAERGFKRDQVYSLLNGRTAGRRGVAHAIAVELGLKTQSPQSLQATVRSHLSADDGQAQDI